MVLCCVVLCCVVLCCVVLCGVVWCDVVWCGVVLGFIVWYGIVPGTGGVSGIYFIMQHRPSERLAWSACRLYCMMRYSKGAFP